MEPGHDGEIRDEGSDDEFEGVDPFGDFEGSVRLSEEVTGAYYQ